MPVVDQRRANGGERDAGRPERDAVRRRQTGVHRSHPEGTTIADRESVISQRRRRNLVADSREGFAGFL